MGQSICAFIQHYEERYISASDSQWEHKVPAVFPLIQHSQPLPVLAVHINNDSQINNNVVVSDSQIHSCMAELNQLPAFYYVVHVELL